MQENQFILNSQKLLSEIIRNANSNLQNNKIALNYAQSRGLTPNIINDFKVGVIPFGIKSQMEDLGSYKLAKKLFPDMSYAELSNLLLKNGIILLFETKEGEVKYKEMFGNRLLIPFYDKNDNPIGFATRRIDALEKDSNFESPKYLNPPESDVFHKREMFFNYKNAKENASKQGFLVLCEGTFDAIAYHKAGITAIAGSGVALSEQQIEMLKTLPTKNIILSYDNDGVGMDSMFKNYVALSKAGFNISFVDYKDIKAKDMDEIVNSKEYGPNTVQELIKHPITEVEFLLKYFEYKATHLELHNKQTNKVEKQTKEYSDLPDLEKYEIITQAQEALYVNNNFKVSPDKKREFENIIATQLNFTVEEATASFKNITNIARQKPTRQFYHFADKNQKRIKPEWSTFENDKTIHYVLDLIGAQKEGTRGNFHRSLWNADKNASLSVKRGQNLWKDFSSGKSGGIYQLVGYLDLSNPEAPVITENPNQTSHIQAYNWLIEKTHSTLPKAQAIDTVNNFSFTETEKKKITNIENYFEKYGEENNKNLAPALSKDSSNEQKNDLLQICPTIYPDVENEETFSSFVVPTRHPNCNYKTFNIAHGVITKNPRKLILCEDTPSFVYIGQETNPRKIDIVFSSENFDSLTNPQASKEFENPTFLINQNPSEDLLNEILNNNYVSINIRNPSKEFLVNYFDILSKSKKPIFINNQDLYSYMIDNYVLKYTEIIKAMGKNNPTNIFAKEIIEKIEKPNKYFSKVFDQAKKGIDYPPMK